MKITLGKLKIINFKGINELEVDFGKETNIYGENGTGKTTIQDAFSFLLFDKDSKDSSKFDVQPVDKKSNPIHNLETVIEAILDVDGKELILKRTYKEKYTKVKGTSKVDFKGYESEYYINEVPHKVTEYKKNIGALLNEDIFKLVTNPVYFSSLDKKKRMEIITEIVGDLDNMDVLDAKKNLEPLRKHLTEYTVNEFMKMIRSKVNKLKDDRSKLPIRIDEANKSIQEFEFATLEKQKISIETEIKNIEEQLQDKSKENEELYSLKAQLMKKQSELMELEYSINSTKNKPREALESDIRTKESSIRHLNVVIEDFEEAINRKKIMITDALNPRRSRLLEEYKAIKEFQFEFDEESCTCPTCKRKFETDDIEVEKTKLQSNFNLEKAKKTERNIAEGKANKLEIEKAELELVDLESKMSEQKAALASSQKALNLKKVELESFKTSPIEESAEVKSIKKEIETLELKVKDFKVADVAELKSKKDKLQSELRTLENQLAFKETNEKTIKRIEDLEAEESKSSEKIAELEGLEILSEEFIRTKVALLEEKVNSKFKYVTFKMFRNQINGGLEEVCEPCFEGVPYGSNLNTAARINCGLDIINTLCNYYKVNAPIFVDNAESVNQLIPVESQIIRLVVSKDKELKIENGTV
jgi:exonuclease SbcC